MSNIRVLIIRYPPRRNGVRGWKKKENAFHRDFHLPDWLDGVERETELALKRRIVRGQSTEEDLEQKMETTRAPCRAARSLDFRGRGRLLSVLAAVSRARGGGGRGREEC